MTPPSNLLLLLFIAVAITAAAAHRPPVGSWEPIKNTNDHHIKKIAEFAVTEHNKHAKKASKLERILSGEKQVVNGIKYRLTVTVGGAAAGKYQTVVLVKRHEKKLITWVPANE